MLSQDFVLLINFDVRVLGAVRSESYARPPARIHPGSMTGFQMIAVANSKTTTECLTIGSLANSILEIVGGNVTVTGRLG